MLVNVVYNTVMITGSPSLRVLDVGGNELGDIGVELLCKELHNNTSLTKLSIWGCNLSVKGTTYMLQCCDNDSLLVKFAK